MKDRIKHILFLSIILLILSREGFAQAITPYNVSVSSATICAGDSVTVTLSNSQPYPVVYGLAASTHTNSIVGNPQYSLSGGVSLSFPTGPLFTTTTFAVVGVTVSSTDTTLMNNFVTVTVNPLPTATIIVSSPTICAGTSATIAASSSNPNNSYSLTPGGFFFSSTTVTPTVTTNYILMVKDDLTTCINTYPIAIVVMHMHANVNWNPPPICVGESPIHLNQTLVPGALHGGTWTVNGTAGDSVLNLSTASVGTTYTVTYAAGTGTCAASQLDTLSVHGLPPVTVNSATICAGTTATLMANGANTYTWNTGGLGDTIIVSPTGNTNYNVTGMSVYGCTNTASTTVTVHALPIISVNTPAICAGTATTLTATGASSYTWNTGAVTSTIIASPTVTTNYTVTGTGAHNCKNISTTTVTVNPLPALTVNSDTLCAGDNVVLLAHGAITYVWMPSTSLNTSSDSLVTATPTITTIYTVTGINASNCKNSTTCTVTIANDSSFFCSKSVNGGSIEVHNAFSPNRDGLNDLFIIDNIEGFPNNHVYIYNRWGQLLWDKPKYNNINVVWDGKTQTGTTLYAGTYFYIIENVGPKSLKGWVEITSTNNN